MNCIYAISLNGVNWQEIADYQAILNSIEQKKIQQLYFQHDKLRSLLGKILLLYILKKHVNYQLNILPDLNYNFYQKPFINEQFGEFNISHSGDWVVCAYSKNHRIGIDIEQKQMVNLDEFRDVLTQTELAAISQGQFDFMQLWTLKEAVIKADGRGFNLAPNSFTLPIPFTNHSMITVDGKTWFLQVQNIEPHYQLAIASSSMLTDCTLRVLDIKSLTSLF